MVLLFLQFILRRLAFPFRHLLVLEQVGFHFLLIQLATQAQKCFGEEETSASSQTQLLFYGRQYIHLQTKRMSVFVQDNVKSIQCEVLSGILIQQGTFACFRVQEGFSCLYYVLDVFLDGFPERLLYVSVSCSGFLRNLEFHVLSEYFVAVQIQVVHDLSQRLLGHLIHMQMRNRV